MAKKRVDIIVNQKGAKRAEKEMHNLGTSVQSTIMKYVGAGVAIAAVTRLFKTSIETYGVQELAEKKLQTALGRTSKELLDYASALQLVSNFGDEQIIEAQALIASFVKNEDAIKELTKSTLDFATALGMDLNAAAQLTSKTIGSSTNALTRYGITVTGAVGSTERLKSITEGIAKVWGGQAAAAADTFTGEINQMSMAWFDLTEKFGGMIANVSKNVPVLEGLAETFRLIGEYIETAKFPSAIEFGYFLGLKATAEDAAEEIKKVLTLEEKQNKINEEYHNNLIQR